MAGQVVHNLPAPRTSLVGREGDVAETRHLVLHGPERLVTLTGVGGGGKTRLALQVARSLADAFSDGVWLVELAPLNDARLIPKTMAAALGVAENSGAEALVRLESALQPRTLLLVLDNCEHLVDACAAVADRLLARCPQLRILATSREPLQVPGERQRRVLPLPIPEPDAVATPEDLAHYPAVQLFVERAGAAAPGFRLTPENSLAVASICTLVAGIPLGIELAAARVRALSVDQIATRLDDCFRILAGGSRVAPTRQQTLRATLDWSYALLTPPEQAVFRRLAPFVGSWSLEAAEAVCSGDGLPEREVLDVLTRLVDKSLVAGEERDGETRYRLLEPIRQYAAHHLAASGESAAAGARHAAFCIALAERAEPELHGERQVEWLRRLDDELDNVRVALARAEERGDAATILRLAGALYYYFWMRRHIREAQHWFETGLASLTGMVEPASARDVLPVLRAKGLFGLALMHSLVGDNGRASSVGHEALAEYRRLEDAGGLALLTAMLAQVTLAQGDLSGARSLAEDSIDYARACKSGWHLAHALVLLGQIIHQQGELVRAVGLHKEALTLFEAAGDRWGRAYAAASLASLDERRPSVARVAALSGVQLYWEVGDRRALASALEYLALQGEQGRPEEQVRLLAAAHALRRSLGILPPLGQRDDVTRQLTLAQADLGAARFRNVWAEGQSASLEQVVAGALRRERLGRRTGPAERRGPVPLETLTPREREVARLLVRECSDRQIADALTITEGTAGLHVHHILVKLGFRSRTQVADWAAAEGMIDSSLV